MGRIPSHATARDLLARAEDPALPADPDAVFAFVHEVAEFLRDLTARTPNQAAGLWSPREQGGSPDA